MKTIASIRILFGLFALAFGFAAQAADGFTVLHEFIGARNGVDAFGRLVQGNDGAFYGTTLAGGIYGTGTVYKVDVDGQFTVLHSFKAPDDGIRPYSGLVLADDGNFYGTTSEGGPCQKPCISGGTVFRMTPEGVITTLHTFEDDEQPYSLAAGSDGLLYGVTEYGGSLGDGSIYSIATDGTYRLLVSFDSTTGIYNPEGRLVEGTDGNIYGTATSGAVFRMTPDGAITLLHSLNGTTEGSGLIAGLVQGNDGRFYGGTQYGGHGYGTLFAITADGDFTVLHAFNGGDGFGLKDALVQGSDGYLYGASRDGGYLGWGTLFRLSTNGRRAVLHLFKGLSAVPASAPILGSDGRLYGTTESSVYSFDLAAPRVPEVHVCVSSCNKVVTTQIGNTVKLEWSSANVAACQASGAWNGIKRSGGNYTFTATQTGTFLYRLDCVGPNGHANAWAVVTVKPR